MAKQITFPLTTKVGATAIRIYKAPVRQKIDGEVKVFDSFLVSYYRAGRRERKRCKNLKIARAEVDRIKVQIGNGDEVALQLTGTDRVIYSNALENSREVGLPIDLIVKDYASAVKELGATPLAQAVQFYKRYGQTITLRKNVPEVVAEMIAGLKADKLSAYHINATKQRLHAFASKFKGEIMSVRTSQITEWLRQLKLQDESKADVPIAPKTRNHYRNAIVQLFNFARDHGYLPKGLPTEAEDVKAVAVVPSQNEIFTATEMRALLTKAPAHLLGPMAIKAFSGVRTEEMLRMRWEHINWKSQHIALPADVTKTSQRRLIPIASNLFEWIKAYQGETGRICNRWKRAQALFQAFDRYGKRVGVDVGANKFRNSFISYRVAVTQDVHRVALESGNSPRVIQREYLELATEDDGKKWFEIAPENTCVFCGA